jgi:hypothetical protein
MARVGEETAKGILESVMVVCEILRLILARRKISGILQ